MKPLVNIRLKKALSPTNHPNSGNIYSLAEIDDLDDILLNLYYSLLQYSTVINVTTVLNYIK
jgi:hypothetical protein